jgi:hypothetical protein
VLVLDVLLVVDEGEVLEVVLLLVVEGSVLVVVLEEVVPVDVFEGGMVLLVVFEFGTELTKVGNVLALPVGVTVLPL